MQTTTQRKVKCNSYLKKIHAANSTWGVPALCKEYGFPTGLTGGGTIGIVELGGGWSPTDLTEYFHSINQPVPTVTDISVDGTNNTHQKPKNDADLEVSLDIQVAAAAYYVATGKPAHIKIFWANDIAPAVTAAAKAGCDVISISWGLDENGWGKAAVEEMEAAALAATQLGSIVFAAAGDNDSSDGGPGAANVDCPGTCPHVVSCGGTKKTMTAETVWNDNPGLSNGEGTGGGYSTIFPTQSWQTNAPKPPHAGLGRLVPDVAANADPDSGYLITVYGQTQVVGGTSAVAPLFAGLFAAFGTKLGYITPELWAHPTCFNDITVGNNGTYHAQVGPDACSGLGSPKAAPLATLLVKK